MFFKLFECQDKALRQLLFRHIIAGEALLSRACGASQRLSIALITATRIPTERGHTLCTTWRRPFAARVQT